MGSEREMRNNNGVMDGARQGDLRSIQSVSFQSVVEQIKKFGSLIYGLAIAVLYVSGFLVLNANLAKYGVLDIEFVNARYFLAAASFVFYMLCFYLFAGRAVFFSKRWFGEDLERMRRAGASTKWVPVVFLHSQLHALFFCCLSSALFTSVAIGSTETHSFYLTLVFSFLILYPLDVSNVDIRYPKLVEVVTIAVKVGAVYVFFAVGSAAVLRSVFFSYLVIFFFINQMLDGFERYKATKDRIFFSVLYAVIVFFGSAVAFGSLLYGQVNLTLGGARPQHVFMGLEGKVGSTLPISVSGASTGYLEGDLIHQTAFYTYVVAANQTIRLRSTDVVSLTTAVAPESNRGIELGKLLMDLKKGQVEAGDNATSKPVAKSTIR